MQAVGRNQPPAADYSQVLDRISKLKRVDFRWLNQETINEFKQLFDHLYNSERLSTTEVGDKIGKSQQFAWSMCKRLGIGLRSRAEGGRIYAPRRTSNVRKPFNGSTLDKAYLQGFARGDLDARRASSLAIMVSTTTTHPDFVSVFESLFRSYGPVYVYPIYDKTGGYKWKVAARLDDSFCFMLLRENPSHPTVNSKDEFLAWLAGFIDSDGSVGMIHSGAYVRLNLQMSNEDTTLLDYTKRELERAGYHPTGPYRSHQKGHETPARHIRYNEDMYYLLLQRLDEVRDMLQLLPLRLREKRRRRDLALRLPSPALWKKAGTQVELLREQIDTEVAWYVRAAEQAYARTSHKRGRESATWRLSRAWRPHRTS